MPRGRRGRGRGLGRPPALPAAAPGLLGPHTPGIGDEQAASSRLAIPIFNPDDYPSWAFKMECFLAASSCWGAINHQANHWVFLTPVEQENMQHKAFAYLSASLGRSYKYIVREHTITQSKELWESLEKMFLLLGNHMRLNLTKALMNLTWRNHHNVNSFLGDLAEIRSAFKSAKIPLTDAEVFTKLLASLPPQFEVEQSLME